MASSNPEQFANRINIMRTIRIANTNRAPIRPRSDLEAEQLSAIEHHERLIMFWNVIAWISAIGAGIGTALLVALALLV